MAKATARRGFAPTRFLDASTLRSGEQAAIGANVKIYPFKTVEPGALVTQSIVWETRGARGVFGERGVSGLVNIDEAAAIRFARDGFPMYPFMRDGMQTLGLGMTWEQLSPGQKFRTLNRTITETDLVMFVGVTGMVEVIFTDHTFGADFDPWGRRGT